MKLFSFWRSLATYRVRIAMNLKGLKPDEIVELNLMKGEQRGEAFRKDKPMMAIPALVDGDGPALFESLAIIEYLDETHPNPPLLPKDERGRARVGGIAQLIAAGSHPPASPRRRGTAPPTAARPPPLIVPPARENLAHQLKPDEPTVMAWCRHWHTQA